MAAAAQEAQLAAGCIAGGRIGRSGRKVTHRNPTPRAARLRRLCDLGFDSVEFHQFAFLDFLLQHVHVIRGQLLLVRIP